MNRQSVDMQVIESIFNLYVGDPVLKQEFGGEVDVYYMYAEPDASFPYIVHRMDVDSGNPSRLLNLGTYIVDVWDAGNNALRLDRIKQRITFLVNNTTLSTAQIDNVARFRLSHWRPLPTDNKAVWRQSGRFSVRMFLD